MGDAPHGMQPERDGVRLIGMRKTLGVTAGVVAAGLVAAGCGAAQPGPRGPVEIRGVAAREPAVSPRPYGAGDTAFGMDVLRTWCQADPQSNLVLSPASLATGLGMAYLGARGATARQMAGVLHLPAASGQTLEAGLQARTAALGGLDGPGVTVTESNQVWADPTLPTRHSYLNAVATGYGAGIRRVPLLRDPARAAQEIDQSIAAATRGHITRLLSPQSLGDIGWVLTDAIYLHAAWATAFQPGQSATAPFRTAAGSEVGATYMHGGMFRTTEADGWTAVSLPYRGGKLSMIALLPGGTSTACPVPSTGALAAITAGLGPDDVDLSSIALPRVNLASQVSMNQVLTRLGMGGAFGSGANFTGLSPDACCIGLVEHAATLRVTEKGTVASAATAVGVEPSDEQAAPRVWFNRPYLLLVTDTATGEPLFLARVANPATR
jgi:serpin B